MRVDMYTLLQAAFERALPFIKNRLEEGNDDRAWDEFSLAMEGFGIRFFDKEGE